MLDLAWLRLVRRSILRRILADELDPPWLASMSSEPEPTVAAFAPTQRRVLVQQQSPLLNATPPQITRALTYSHPFLLPLTKLVGLLSWSGDPWESFLVVAVFWATVLYGDEVIRWAGPLVVGGLLVGGLYLRRYSPLSTRSHRKSLDEIVETLNTFTARCNVLVEPLLQLTEFLSTQRSPTSTTTRPALTTLLLRLLALLPIWIVPTIATRHVMLVAGTLILSWHSRPARISRTLLWRSRTVRRLVSFITGLRLTPEKSYAAVTTGVKFTFTLWQNQRRWLGLGWTSSMLAYERAAWTDEHLNASPSKDDFKPTVNGAVWKWVSEWKDDGWIYYDNKVSSPLRAYIANRRSGTMGVDRTGGEDIRGDANGTAMLSLSKRTRQNYLPMRHLPMRHLPMRYLPMRRFPRRLIQRLRSGDFSRETRLHRAVQNLC